MSSLHCPTCHERIWDKYLGNTKPAKEVRGTFYCLQCLGDKRYKPLKEIKK